jgi:hypothetical protein
LPSFSPQKSSIFEIFTCFFTVSVYKIPIYGNSYNFPSDFPLFVGF